MDKEFTEPPAPESIMEAVADCFQVTTSELKGQKRPERIVFPRQVAMYLIRQETDCSLAQTGQVLGGRCPATISYGYQRIAKRMANNSGMKKRIVELQEQISKKRRRKMTIVTIAQFSIALEGERSKEDLEELAKKIHLSCLTEKDIVYGPSVWLEDYDVRDMEIITREK